MFNYYKRRPHHFKKRLRILDWTLKILSKLSLNKRTQELVLLLMDSLLVKDLAIKKFELFCVSCVFLVVKLEGDITAEVASFNNYVQNTLCFAKKELQTMEALILDNIPENFAHFTTFSEFNACLVSVSSKYVKPVHNLADSLNDICSRFYLNNLADVDAFSLSVAAFFACVGPKDERAKFVGVLGPLMEGRSHNQWPIRLDCVKTILPTVFGISNSIRAEQEK